jgi:VWFA-related protein
MNLRCFLLAMCCAAAAAQLPPAQAPPPVEASAKSRKGGAPHAVWEWRVDAVVTDAARRSIPDLTAADFELLAGGKPQKIAGAEFHSATPLRLAMVVDDLSLSPERVAAVKDALRRFVNGGMPAGAEAAIFRASAGDGLLDTFTSDAAALGAAIDRLESRRPADTSAPAFTAGSLGALRGVLTGLDFTPGRKLAVFFSERLRDEGRSNQPAWTTRLVSTANRSSVVVYAVDLGSKTGPSMTLYQGLADVTRDTGGVFFDDADPAAALRRILDAPTGYYTLGFESDSWQSPTEIAVTARRPNLQVRARRGPVGLEGDQGAPGYVTPDSELTAALVTGVARGMHLGLRMEPGNQADPALIAVLHVDLRDVAFTTGADGIYRGRVEAAAALFQDAEAAAGQASRSLSLQFSREQHGKFLETGLDIPLRLPAPKPGPTHLRAAVLDLGTGRTGTARVFFEAADLPPALPTISEIQMEGAPPLPPRVYSPGHAVRYTYEVGNLRRNASGHAVIEVTNQILRDGQPVYTSPSSKVDIALPSDTARGLVGGVIKLGAQMKPGRYALRVTVVETLAPGSARPTGSKSVEFEVR